MRGRRVSKPKMKFLSVLLAAAMVVGILPPVTVPVNAAGETFTFSSGAVLLDESYSGDNVIIYPGVFSVAVSGATDVTIIFDGSENEDKVNNETGEEIPDGKPDGITIDHRAASDPDRGRQVENLYAVSQGLGWGNVAQTCPFLITGNSTVTAGFRGTWTFYAGTNGCTVSNNDTYTANATGAGFAGIQVDSGSSLTIFQAEKLTVYGAHQLAAPENGKVPGTNTNYSEALRANRDITAAGYDDPWDDLYRIPTNSKEFTQSGGAGIGGGAAYNTTSSAANDYVQGTPGTIIINSGNIEVFGGHAAAGIGGGINSAATTEQIVINGGNIIAHGGRFAAGIGDGDSVPNGENQGPSPNFVEANGRIEVNGGTVTAYGGVAAPGIGCTDDICEGTKGFGEDATSGLEIAINGGTVNAFSGFPSDFSGQYSNKWAPAAIGAGSGSAMEQNSIYISSNADLSCAGFGNYSLTEAGNDSDHVPVINIDSDGYLLLLRTEDYYSSAERELKLYYPQKYTDESGKEYVIYVDQTTGRKYYHYQSPDGTDVVCDDKFNPLDLTDVPTNLTLYVDENSKLIQTIDLAYYFRSIALTLPDPEEFGGLYALSVPTKGVSNNVGKPGGGADIVLTVEAKNQGTQSGYIKYPSQHNMGKDAVSKPLTDLDINGGAATDGLIGNEFRPKVYAYTVYIESDAETADLFAAFEGASSTNAGTTLTLDGQTLTPTHADGTTWTVSAEIGMQNVSQKTVRLKKQDGSIAAISYKITIVKKGDYNLELSDPGKTYDGTPAVAKPSAVYSSAPYVITKNTDGVESNQTLNAGTIGQSSTLYCGSTGNNYWPTYYYLNLNTSLSVTKTDRPNVLRYVLTVTAARNNSGGSFSGINSNGYRMGWDVTYDETTGGIGSITPITTRPSGVPNNVTWLASAGAIATFSNNPVTLTPNADRTVTVNSNGGTDYLLFSLGDVTRTSTVSDSETEAYQNAKAAVESGQTTGTFPYTVSSSYQWSQAVTLGKITANTSNRTNSHSTSSQTITNAYSQTGTAYYALTAATDRQQVSIPEADLAEAVLTYSRLESNGTYTKLDGPPTDAGTYRVEGKITAETYNASGSRIFTIDKRPVTVLQIKNWLTYLTGDEMKDLSGETLPITNPGAIQLENVVAADANDVKVTATSVYYNNLEVAFGSNKITLEGLTLSGGRAHNYSIDSTRTVFGQIAYDMTGALFRKKADGNDWRKYYPVDSTDPVGTNGIEPDYHSPVTDGVYLSHAEYVKARTVNQGEAAARYAVDIEFGPMQFGFYRSAWDVNELVYVELVDSHWTGMDGKNNRLELTNYSNRSVWYRMVPDIDFIHEDISHNGQGITAKITSDAGGTNVVDDTVWSEIEAATPGSVTTPGTKKTSARYLMLSGVPQMESSTYIPVGSVTIYVSPTDPNSA